MAIDLTEAANKKIAALKMQRQTPDDLLKICLKSGGCSGYTFKTEFISQPQTGDRVFEFDQDVKICIDSKSYLFLNGTLIDYEEDLMKSGFVFKVPNAARMCGCGESVSF